LLDRVSTLLAGRVAEQVVLNEISTGAQNDLERATSIVRQMIMEYGMSEELGPITLGKKQGQVFLGRDLARDRDFSEEIAKAIDKEIRNIIDRCYRKAEETIRNNRDKLEQIANALLEKETMDAAEIEAIMEGKSLEDLQETEEKTSAEKDSPESGAGNQNKNEQADDSPSAEKNKKEDKQVPEKKIRISFQSKGTDDQNKGDS
ncbi:MAG: cell division protein FtsH, partial [Firmicutes bacterium]|nr:cell division protein FtsH [Bacillota bacterium]